MTPEEVKLLVERLKDAHDFFMKRPAAAYPISLTEMSKREADDVAARFDEAASALTLLAQEREELRGALRGADIAIARDEHVEAAHAIIRSALKDT